jgi:hypothetical protein
MFEIDSYLLGRSEIAPLSRTPSVYRRLFSKVLTRRSILLTNALPDSRDDICIHHSEHTSTR